jgi:hypothetical protein
VVNSSWHLGWARGSSCLKKRGLDSFILKMDAVHCWVDNDALWVVNATVNLAALPRGARTTALKVTEL